MTTTMTVNHPNQIWKTHFVVHIGLEEAKDQEDLLEKENIEVAHVHKAETEGMTTKVGPLRPQILKIPANLEKAPKSVAVILI